jgi:uncharacterized protein YraI
VPLLQTSNRLSSLTLVSVSSSVKSLPPTRPQSIGVFAQGQRPCLECCWQMSRWTEIADGRLRVFKYLSRFKTNIIAF